MAAGQDQTDTLTMARSLRERGKTRKSMTLLKPYYQAHPDDLYANWIYAQTAYQAHRFNLSADLYAKALKLYPTNRYLRLDYAKTLVDIGDLEKGSEQLQIYTSEDISNPEPWYYMAKIDYWKGEPVQALKLLDQLLSHVPDYVPAKNLKAQILQDLAPWVGLNATYSSDDQPMNLLTPSLKGGWYRSHLLGLDFQVSVPCSFRDNGDFYAIGFSAGNKFHFSRPNLNLFLNLGLFNHTTLKSLGWTGDFKIEKTLLKKMSLWVELQRKPYLSTLSSLDIPLFENHLSIAGAWNDPERWNGQLSFEGSTFSSDNNYILAFCGWVFVPSFHAGRFDFHFGYGYNYSTSKESRFTNEMPHTDIIARWNTGMEIKGIYNPYFTPNNQQIHSLLGIIHFKAARTVMLTLNLNCGIYGTTQYPYLYLEKDPYDSIFINRAFEKETFFPVNINAGFTWNMLKNLDILADLNYNATIYYNTINFGLTVRKRL
jgi:hypothetical protein